MMFVLFEHPAGRRDAFADIDSISRCHSECEAKDYSVAFIINRNYQNIWKAILG